QLTKTIPSATNSRHRSPLRPGLFLLALACFALSPIAPAKPRPTPTPTPDGDLGNGNTAEGNGALFSNTGGAQNTADGYQALYSNTTGTDNTANGYQAHRIEFCRPIRRVISS